MFANYSLKIFINSSVPSNTSTFANLLLSTFIASPFSSSLSFVKRYVNAKTTIVDIVAPTSCRVFYAERRSGGSTQEEL